MQTAAVVLIDAQNVLRSRWPNVPSDQELQMKLFDFNIALSGGVRLDGLEDFGVVLTEDGMVQISESTHPRECVVDMRGHGLHPTRRMVVQKTSPSVLVIQVRRLD